MGLFTRKSEPVEVQAVRQAMRRAGRRMAIHDALAPVQPGKINPATGRTNRDMRARAKAARAERG